jgi:hypothetical protein
MASLTGDVTPLGGDVREYSAEVALPTGYRSRKYAELIYRSQVDGRLVLFVAVNELKDP